MSGLKVRDLLAKKGDPLQLEALKIGRAHV